MRVVGKDFMVALAFDKDGRVAKTDRILAFMIDWPIARVIARADRWGWRLELSDEEREQVARRDEQAAATDR
jgi:hypothetical protein